MIWIPAGIMHRLRHESVTNRVKSDVKLLRGTICGSLVAGPYRRSTRRSGLSEWSWTEDRSVRDPAHPRAETRPCRSPRNESAHSRRPLFLSSSYLFFEPFGTSMRAGKRSGVSSPSSTSCHGCIVTSLTTIESCHLCDARELLRTVRVSKRPGKGLMGTASTFTDAKYPVERGGLR